MGALAFSFAQPLVLLGLVALPVIWWLLRLTPPKPQSEVFPPLRILARVLKKEETPHQSPWWLTLLRLLMAAIIIFALAEPVFNPRERIAADGSALALVVDNGWASAHDWKNRVATTDRLIADANDRGIPVVLAFTADQPNAEIGPSDAATARDRLNAATARPVPVDRPAVYARVAGAISALPGATVAILSDGLASERDEEAFSTLLAAGAGRLIWAQPGELRMLGLSQVENSPEALTVTAIRSATDAAPRQAAIGAFDERGRRIADATIAFGAGETSGMAELRVPFELRNDFASMTIDGEEQAAAIRLLDENSRRRRVGLLSQSEADQAQPLLSPLYYIRRAMAPYADLVEPAEPDLARAVPGLIAMKPAMIVMADVGTLPDAAQTALVEWLEGGGTLVRFAGSRLAAADHDEELLPVRLRTGERTLGGALSWTEPQPVAQFPATSPFADLDAPSEVSVVRQVLAEPSSDIVERTWASLADGTPLVTGARRGTGTLVLFHVTPEATWSNLPISGSFVEMLRRLVQISRNQGRMEAQTGGVGATLPPYRTISATGVLGPPAPDARPLPATGSPPVTIENPPGFYGTDEGVIAHNLLSSDASFAPIVRPQTPLPVSEARYEADESFDLKGPLFATALVLMIVDTVAVVLLGGLLSRLRRPGRRAAAGSILLAGALFAGSPDPATAQDERPGDAEAIAAISATRIAYVQTGDPSVDAISRAGIDGLNRFLLDKTALQPGDPAGVDIATDELSFYPLIYWPIDAAAAMPTQEAIARVDAYMQQGGSVLFDTRDQLVGGMEFGSASPATERLRDILDNLNVPALEPVPEDHVLTKSFYILDDFPGRLTGSPLWVEASTVATRREDRPVRTGDGVSPILITGNDLAGAWAIDGNGQAMLPTIPADPMQRVYAFRAGVNIMMYMLTGNYKSDQVHVPVLLERLGQ